MPSETETSFGENRASKISEGDAFARLPKDLRGADQSLLLLIGPPPCGSRLLGPSLRDRGR